MRRLVSRVVLLFAVASLVGGLFPCIAEGGTIPDAHSALLLTKCLPYNTAWDDNSQITLLVLGCDPGTKTIATEAFAKHLVEISTKLGNSDPEHRGLVLSVSTLSEFKTFASDPPDAVFLFEGTSGKQLLDPERLRVISAAAALHGVLVFTDSQAAFKNGAGILFSLSAKKRPEISGDLNRIQEQGGKLQGTFLRLLKRSGDR